MDAELAEGVTRRGFPEAKPLGEGEVGGRLRQSRDQDPIDRRFNGRRDLGGRTITDNGVRNASVRQGTVVRQQTVRPHGETGFDRGLGGSPDDFNGERRAGRLGLGADIAIEGDQQTVLGRQDGQQEGMHRGVFAGIDAQSGQGGGLAIPRDDDLRSGLGRTLREGAVVHPHEDDHAGRMDRSRPQRRERDLTRHELTDTRLEIAVLLSELGEETQGNRRHAELRDARAHPGQGTAEFGELFEVQT